MVTWWGDEAGCGPRWEAEASSRGWCPLCSQGIGDQPSGSEPTSLELQTCPHPQLDHQLLEVRGHILALPISSQHLGPIATNLGRSPGCHWSPSITLMMLPKDIQKEMLPSPEIFKKCKIKKYHSRSKQ